VRVAAMAEPLDYEPDANVVTVLTVVAIFVAVMVVVVLLWQNVALRLAPSSTHGRRPWGGGPRPEEQACVCCGPCLACGGDCPLGACNRPSDAQRVPDRWPREGQVRTRRHLATTRGVDRFGAGEGGDLSLRGTGNVGGGGGGNLTAGGGSSGLAALRRSVGRPMAATVGTRSSGVRTRLALRLRRQRRADRPVDPLNRARNAKHTGTVGALPSSAVWSVMRQGVGGTSRREGRGPDEAGDDDAAPVMALGPPSAIFERAAPPPVRALFVGIGYHRQAPRFRLGMNPENDAYAMARLLSRDLGVRHQVVLTDRTAVRADSANLRLALHWLTAAPLTAECRMWWHFSGHCQQVMHQGPRLAAADLERVGKDDALVTADLRYLDSDFLWTALVRRVADTEARLMVTLDACQCGTALDLPHNMRYDRAAGRMMRVPGATRRRAPLPARCCVVVFSACADWETAKNGPPDGAAGKRVGGALPMGAWTDAFTQVLARDGVHQTAEYVAVQLQRYLDAEGIAQDIQLSCVYPADVRRPMSDFGAPPTALEASQA
jgi:hypothetical protein